MVERVSLRLQVEKVPWVADMRLQPGRHLAERLEQPGKHRAIGVGQGIFVIDLIERGGALVGVDHDLHRVPSVVDTGQRAA